MKSGTIFDTKGIGNYAKNCKTGYNLWQAKSDTIFDTKDIGKYAKNCKTGYNPTTLMDDETVVTLDNLHKLQSQEAPEAVEDLALP